jgi:hypothetical protein
MFPIYLILTAALGPGVNSASNRNEYHKHTNMFLGSKLELTTLTPSASRLSRQCGILNMSQSYRPPPPGTGIASLSLLIYILMQLWGVLDR